LVHGPEKLTVTWPGVLLELTEDALEQFMLKTTLFDIHRAYQEEVVGQLSIQLSLPVEIALHLSSKQVSPE
jgi:hypothetical protein